jgi:hypothetical protein
LAFKKKSEFSAKNCLKSLKVVTITLAPDLGGSQRVRHRQDGRGLRQDRPKEEGHRIEGSCKSLSCSDAECYVFTSKCGMAKYWKCQIYLTATDRPLQGCQQFNFDQFWPSSYDVKIFWLLDMYRPECIVSIYAGTPVPNEMCTKSCIWSVFVLLILPFCLQRNDDLCDTFLVFFVDNTHNRTLGTWNNLGSRGLHSRNRLRYSIGIRPCEQVDVKIEK